MIVGLLDPRWETRHGCSLGLTGLLNGLGNYLKVYMYGLICVSVLACVQICVHTFVCSTYAFLGMNINECMFMCAYIFKGLVGFSEGLLSTEGTNPVGAGSDQADSKEIDEKAVMIYDAFSTTTTTSTPSSSFPSTLSSSPPPPTLPQYLVEDVICTGLCLLMLDRFLDLGSSSSIVVSPAKEVVNYVYIDLCVYAFAYLLI